MAVILVNVVMVVVVIILVVDSVLQHVAAIQVNAEMVALLILHADLIIVVAVVIVDSVKMVVHQILLANQIILHVGAIQEYVVTGVIVI